MKTSGCFVDVSRDVTERERVLQGRMKGSLAGVGEAAPNPCLPTPAPEREAFPESESGCPDSAGEYKWVRALNPKP